MPVSDRPSPAPSTIPNFRDIGGQRSVDGRTVRTGLLYRSVALDAATASDLRALSALGVRTVIDLRTAMEQERRPDRVPEGASHLPLDLLVDSGESDPSAVFALMQDPPRASHELGGGETDRFYRATYRDMIRLPSARAGYARFYRTLADAEARPALVHCTTGKDRTGWAVASLLMFLGVDQDEVMAEYMISDAVVRQAYRHVIDDFVARGGDRAVIEPLMSVHPSFLGAALEAMAEDHGSIDAYLRDGLRLDDDTLAALRAAFLA